MPSAACSSARVDFRIRRRVRPACTGPSDHTEALIPTHSDRSARVLLVSLRDADDPMAEHEAGCFAEHLGLPRAALDLHPMPSGRPRLDEVGLVLFGGSGAYSVLDHGHVPWIREAIDVLVDVVDRKIPAWASCFGFQGLALALGGEVNHDEARAELGAVELEVTEHAASDPVFSTLPRRFWAQLGHHDHVDRLPSGVTLLARGDAIPHQAFKVDGAPFWAAQFHPELTVRTTLDRALHYAEHYMDEEVAQAVLDHIRSGRDTPAVSTLLRHLRQHVGA